MMSIMFSSFLERKGSTFLFETICCLILFFLNSHKRLKEYHLLDTLELFCALYGLLVYEGVDSLFNVITDH